MLGCVVDLAVELRCPADRRVRIGEIVAVVVRSGALGRMVLHRSLAPGLWQDGKVVDGKKHRASSGIGHHLDAALRLAREPRRGLGVIAQGRREASASRETFRVQRVAREAIQ